MFGRRSSSQESESGDGDGDEPLPAAVGRYTWEDFAAEFGSEAAADPGAHLGFDPEDTQERVESAAGVAKGLQEVFEEYLDPATTPVTKDVYTWEHYKWEYYYDPDGTAPRDGESGKIPFDRSDSLGYGVDDVRGVLAQAADFGEELHGVVDERTVDVDSDVDEDAFFSTADGHTTVSNRYDLEKAVSMESKRHFREIDRYWVNKPYAFVVIFHSEKENEKKYYLVEPYLTSLEKDLQEFLTEKLRTAIKYTDEGVVVEDNPEERRAVIDEQTRRLLERYDLYSDASGQSILETLVGLLGQGSADADDDDDDGGIEGLSVRPEPALLAEDAEALSEYQVEKLLYVLKRDFIGYERIDGVKHDINVEDVSCDGYHSPVFVYHTDYEQLITNVYHGRERLDDFVVKLAQRSGKGISKRQPQVDATLPDGSRAQLTLGREVSDHGTNYTIRQFKDVPFTPVDLINWNTFSLDMVAYLWLAIENNKSVIFAGGTASGKTTNLNAVSLFIPSNTKIVSIEDTREVELPQRNWIASVTRPSFSGDDVGNIDEFSLLEAALRQRPDYIVMGEIRGEEGRTLFQVMSTGHTTYTTFHADNVSEVIKRFTTDPINVSKTLFSALDLVSIQTQTRVQGRKVRRAKTLTEINRYDTENDEINVQDVFEWRPETDEFEQHAQSRTLEDIQFDRGWTQADLDDELFKRRVVIAYLITRGLNQYAQVAATVQAFISDQDTILTLIANDELEERLESLRGMESVLIDVDPEKEAMVPRPDPGEDVLQTATKILERAEAELLDEYRGEQAPDLTSALDHLTGEDATDHHDDRSDEESDFDEAIAEAFAEPIGEADVGDEGHLGSTADAFEDDAAGGPSFDDEYGANADGSRDATGQTDDDRIGWNGEGAVSDDPDHGDEPSGETSDGAEDGSERDDRTGPDDGDESDDLPPVSDDDEFEWEEP